MRKLTDKATKAWEQRLRSAKKKSTNKPALVPPPIAATAKPFALLLYIPYTLFTNIIEILSEEVKNHVVAGSVGRPPNRSSLIVKLLEEAVAARRSRS